MWCYGGGNSPFLFSGCTVCRGVTDNKEHVCSKQMVCHGYKGVL